MRAATTSGSSIKEVRHFGTVAKRKKTPVQRFEDGSSVQYSTNRRGQPVKKLKRAKGR